LQPAIGNLCLGGHKSREKLLFATQNQAFV
jgi:hypothetical protein